MKRAKQAFKKYLIPQKGNDNQPYLLRPHVIVFFIVIAIVAESAFIFGAKYIIPQSQLFGIVEVNTLVDETNQNRTENALPALTVSPLLQEAAQEKADDMVKSGYFAHTSPTGVTPWYWFENVGYSFSYAGENLAVNFSDSEDVTNAWMNSPEHRANILGSEYTQIGIATAQGDYNGEPATYVVEEFGTPATSPIEFIDAAAAASVATTGPMLAPTTASAPTPTPAPTAPVPAVAAASPAPAKKSVAPIPVAVPVVTTIVSAQNVQTSSAQAASVAVAGASTVAPVLPATTTSANTAPVAAPTSVSAPAPVAQSNIVQQWFSDPKTVTNDFYLFLMILFFTALILNIFINIRVQYPRLIIGGLMVVVVAGLCIMLNQDIGFLHAIVL